VEEIGATRGAQRRFPLLVGGLTRMYLKKTRVVAGRKQSATPRTTGSNRLRQPCTLRRSLDR
jgi:hypothetical protein